MDYTNSFASRDAKDLGRKADGAFYTEILILGAVDEVESDCKREINSEYMEVMMTTYTSRGWQRCCW